MRWMYSEVRDKINQWSSTIQTPSPSNKSRCIDSFDYDLSQTHGSVSMHRKTLPGISSPTSGNDAVLLSGYYTVLLACAGFAIQFNKNATFDLQFAGRVSNLNFTAYSFPGWHSWSFKANVSFQIEFVKSLCSISKIFNLAENSNRDKKEIAWGEKIL